MKIDEIRTIVQLMSEHDLTEFKIEAEDMHLCIRRGSHPSGHPVITHNVLPQASIVPMQEKLTDSKNTAVREDSNKIENPVHKNTVDSPIVGTFYKAPAPDAEPFVKVGAKVTADTIVCIIEAMKVMNEIKAEKAGVIKEILVENGQPVEFGQPLFVLE